MRDFIGLVLVLLQCLEESGEWPTGVVKRSHLQSASGDRLVLILSYFTSYTLRHSLHQHSLASPVNTAASSADSIIALKAQLIVSSKRSVDSIVQQSIEMNEWKLAADELYITNKTVNNRLKSVREEEERLIQTVEPYVLSIEGEQRRIVISNELTIAYNKLNQFISHTNTNRTAALTEVTNNQQHVWQPTTLHSSQFQQAATNKQPLPLTKNGAVDAAAVVRRWKDELKRVRDVIAEVAEKRAVLVAGVSEVEGRVREQQEVSGDVERLQQQVQKALALPSSFARPSVVAVECDSKLSLHRSLRRSNVPKTAANPLPKLADLPPLDNMIVQPSQAKNPFSHQSHDHLLTAHSPAATYIENHEQEDQLSQSSLLSVTPFKPAQMVDASILPSSPFAYESSAGLLDESIELIDQF